MSELVSAADILLSCALCFCTGRAVVAIQQSSIWKKCKSLQFNGEESGGGGDDDDDGDIDEGHDDVWYSIEQHLKGVHKSAVGTSGTVIGLECKKAKQKGSPTDFWVSWVG